MEKKEEGMVLNIASKPDIAKGEFANLVLLTTHGDECRFDFIFVDRVPNDDGHVQEGYLVSRVSLPPSQLAAMRDMIDNHLKKAE